MNGVVAVALAADVVTNPRCLDDPLTNTTTMPQTTSVLAAGEVVVTARASLWGHHAKSG